MAFSPHQQLGQQQQHQQQQLMPTSSVQNMNRQQQREIEKEKKRQVKKELRQHFNQLVRQAKKHENNANSQNDKEELLQALLIFRRAQDVHDKLFGSSRDRSSLDKKVETLEQKCYDWEVGCESFAYLEIISDFEKYGIIPPLTENHEHWYQSHLTLDYHLLSRSNNNNNDDENENENEIEDYMLPNETFSQLYDYQRDCVRWLWGLHEMKIGGILGDDMGLGKTVQTAAFLRGAFHSGLIKCVLLIVPVSVMEHWVREITKWCPENRILGYHTSITKKQRGKNLRKVVKRGGILITTYGMVLNNAETLSMPLNNNINGSAVWDYMILDEGHKIKNHTIGTAKAVREIAVKDCHRIILSGTFLQNSLSELWSLIDFISETRLLGPFKQFNQQFTHRINKSQMKDADACERKLGNAMIELLKNTIDPYLLRRTKLQIKNLNDKLKRAKIAEMKENNNENENENGQKLFEPKILKASKREIVVWVKICPYQAKLYRQFLESDSVKDALNSTKSPLAALTVLKKICDHPFLLSKNMIAACKQGEQAKAKSNQHMNANVNVNNENFNNTNNLNNVNMVNNFMNNSNNNNSGDVINNKNNNDNNNNSNSKNKNEKDSMFSFNELQKYQNDTSPQNALKYSTKMGVLLKILEAIKQGNSHRVLIFSQFKIILSLIESLLKSKNMVYLRMDGDTDVLTRQTYVDQFNNDSSIFVFLLTTGVGSLGLNLIGADRVIIFDPDWNPAKDAQAVDRAYRVGQERNVLVYRLVTCATIEEKIYRRQVSKIGLLKSVTERNFAQRSRQQRYFTKKELKQVFKLDDPNVSETQRLFSRFNNVMIGKNIQFDNEIQRLDLISQVFGISYHDILFRLEGNGNGSGDGEQEEGEEIDSNINCEIDSIRQSLEAQSMSIQRGSRIVRKRQGTNTRKKAENQGIESFFGNDFANELGDVRKKLSMTDLNDVGAPRNNRNINNGNKNDNGSNGNSNEDNDDNYLFLNRLKQLEQKQQENDKDKESENVSIEKKRRAKKRRQSLVEVFEHIQQKDDENENANEDDEDEDSGNSNSNSNGNSSVQNNFFNVNENNEFGSNSLSSVSWFGDRFENEKEKEDRDSDATVSDYESDEMNKNRNNKNMIEASFVSILDENKKQREKEEKENNNVNNAHKNEHLTNDKVNSDINSDEKEIEEIKSHISIKAQKKIASDFKKYRRKSKMFSIADLDDLNDIDGDGDDDENDNGNGNDNVIDDENDENDENDSNEDDETQSEEDEGESETETEGETETDDDIDMTGVGMSKENDRMNDNKKNNISNRHDKNNGKRNGSSKKMKNKACLFHKSNSSKHGYKCTRCECFLTNEQEKEYQTLIRNARICEKEQEWVNAIKHYLIALKIRDSDVNVHVTCETLGKMLAM